MTPVLKKGSQDDLSNYRPVSCLPAASKLLERIIRDQLSIYFEENDLLPKNQHGFCTNKSTMTAWTELQDKWTKNNEEGDITGIVMWDLSASFDTIDASIMCGKLKLYLAGW